MCGIAGFLDLRHETSSTNLNHIAGAMAESMEHRGPDDIGTWTNAEQGIALAHSRLAVRDLTSAGHQPMTAGNDRYLIVYNGEIYDIDPIRAELVSMGITFNGTSDTEVLLNTCIVFGVEKAVLRLNGMFAFAIWDREDQTLWLVRDRMGIKPLYWAMTENLFLFASELKALAAHPNWLPKIDRNSLAAFVTLSYVPSPLSIWQSTFKLEPGMILKKSLHQEPCLKRYWDMSAIVGQERDIHEVENASEELEKLLRQSVRRRLVSDVPHGAFLSGGVDSSLITAIMAAESDNRIQTFTVRFDEVKYDESEIAAEVARHLSTNHASITVTPQDALDLVPDIPRWFDEPFADSSQIPTMLVSKFARRHVTVVLSGDGGDELFAGYNRHIWAARYWPLQQRIPYWFRQIVAAGLEFVPPHMWDLLHKSLNLRQPGEKAHKLAAVLRTVNLDSAYHALASHGVDTRGLVFGGVEPMPPSTDLRNPVERLQFLDISRYLPDDILTKVDRASMSVGLEARVPMLDHEVVQMAWRLAPQLKVINGQGKYLLRSVLYKFLPPHLFERRAKSGFNIPLDSWLRGPLRNWAEDLLSPSKLKYEGYLDVEKVQYWWREHLSGRRNRQQVLWNVLMFQAWLEYGNNG